MSGSKFASLAPEIVEIVANELEIYDAKNLRLVNRSFAAALEKIFLRSIVLSVHPDSAKAHMERLKQMFTCLQQGHSAVTVTRRLVLDIESVTPYESWGEVAVAKEWLSLEEELKMFLPYVIRSFKNISELQWNYQETDLDWTNDVMTEALRPYFGKLHSVDIPILSTDHVELLKGLRKLKQFKAGIDADPWLSTSLGPLETVIETNSSSLEVLDLTSTAGSDIHIEEFLQFSSPVLKGLPSLKSLRLTWGSEALTFTPIDEKSNFNLFPRLESLTLTLSSLEDDEPLEDDETCDLWTLLKDSGVRLKHIDLSLSQPVPPSLIDYLTSYSNQLQSFSVKWNRNMLNSANQSLDPLVTPLLSNALRHHQLSLRSFRISTSHTNADNQWPLVALVNDFLKLSYPKLDQVSVKVTLGPSIDEASATLKTLLDGVLKHNPQVSRLNIDFRHNSEPTSDEHHASEAIAAYRYNLPEDVQDGVQIRLPVLSTDRGPWMPVQSPNGWKYLRSF